MCATLRSVMGRPSSSEARQRIVDATLELLRTEGVRGVTGDEVARRSGVAKTTLYRHFGSTDALVFAVVEETVTATPLPDTGSLRSDLELVHREYLAIAAAPPVRELFAWMVAKALEGPENAERFRRARVQPRGPTALALQRAIGRGEIDPEIDMDLAMHMVQGPLISKRIVANDDVSATGLDRILDMTLRALGAVDPVGGARG